MKQTIATVALLTVALMLCGVILVQVGSTTAQRREKEYRIQAAAEQMVRRLSDGADKIADACKRTGSANVNCRQPHVEAFLFGQRIREMAANGDEKQLAIVTNVLKNFETNTEMLLRRIN